MRINILTITGADDKISIATLQSLGERYSFVEWGILFSKGNRGTPRYPSSEWIQRLSNFSALRLSAHFCGWYASSILQHQQFSLIDNLDPQFKRIQLNYNFEHAVGHHVNSIVVYAYDHPEREFILQYNKNNQKVLDTLLTRELPSNIHFLYDASGGRGIPFSDVKRPIKNQYTGYAGGISNGNIEAVIKQLELHPDPTKIWIDLESGVRDANNEMSIVQVDKMIEACYGHIH